MAALTIDIAFFRKSDAAVLERIFDLSSGAIEVQASRFPYDSTHQSHEFLDSKDLLKQTKPLPFAGRTLTEQETVKQFQVGYDSSPEYIARLNEDDVNQLAKFSVRLYGKRTLFPYQEYRMMALHEHRCASGDLFVTCDDRHILSERAQPLLDEWGISVASPSEALAIAKTYC